MPRKPTTSSNLGAVQKFIDTAYDEMKVLYENLDSLLTVEAGLDSLIVYQGGLSAPPSERTDGTPLEDGDYYFDTGVEGIGFYIEESDEWVYINPSELHNYMEETIAARDAALVAEASAQEAQTSANVSASEANASAEEAFLSAGTAAGDSLLAQEAAVSATASAVSATSSEENSAVSASAAKNSEDIATAAAVDAVAAETAAEASKDAVEASHLAVAVIEQNVDSLADDAQTSATAAAVSEANAEISELAAKASEVASVTAETNATLSAQAAELAETEAVTAATTATNKATDAGNSASSANTSKVNAAASATTAESAKDTAVTSANTAVTKASEASASELNAAKSETAVLLAEANVETVEAHVIALEASTLAAASDATAAKEAAQSSESAAIAAETGAVTAKNTAITKATEASSSATEALESENAAKVSETNAGQSELSANASKIAANTSALSSAASESAAASSASSALTSKNSATTSASNASASETAARISESNAASSEATASTAASTAVTKANAASTSATLAAASAEDAHVEAERAKTYAEAASSALVPKGDWDASNGVFPTPTASPERADFYQISVAGTMSNSDATQEDISVEVSDQLYWNVDKDVWYKIDNTDLVRTVDGKQGDVVIDKYTKSETNALLAGKANSSHTHDITDVTGLPEALAGKVDDSQVLTDVPANAVFTDTNTWRNVDNTPVNGQTEESISSNWAYDHSTSSTAHPRDSRNLAIGANAVSATKLATARTIDIAGDITATAVAFDGTKNITISATVNNDSHTHEWGNIGGKPDTFTPSPHTHVESDISNLDKYTQGQVDALLNVKSDVHTHPYRPDNWVPSWNEVTGKPATFTPTTENVQDITGAMFSGNSESGITAVYQDADGTIDLNVNDPTITLTGDVSGSATMTNLGNVSITTTVANDSHNHDGRYYTEAESNARFAPINGAGYLPLDGGELSGEVRMSNDFVLERSFNMLENVATQYILLCHNSGNNNVNGSITINRTSGNYQAANLDIVVSSGSSITPFGTILSLQSTQQDEEYRLVTVTVDDTSWVAVKYTGNSYPMTLPCSFTGRITSKTGSLTTVSAVTNEAPLKSNDKFELNGESIFHEGYHPNADKLTTARSIALTGDATGTVSFDGSSNVTMAVDVNEAAHALVADKVDIVTSFSGKYPMTVNVNGLMYSHTGVQYEGASGTVFATKFDGDLIGNATSATTATTATSATSANSASRWTTARTLTLTGDVSGSASIDGSANKSLAVVVANDSHTHDTRYRPVLTLTPGANHYFRIATVNGDDNHAQILVSNTGDYGDPEMGTYLVSAGTRRGVYSLRVNELMATGADTPTFYTRATSTNNIEIWAKISDYNTPVSAQLLGSDGASLLMDSSTATAPSNLVASTMYSFTGDFSVSGTIKEGGTLLSSKYLGSTANAASASKWATARTVSLSGDASGSFAIDGTSNATMSVTVANDSHTHDGRYYTETESNARFLGISAKAADAQLLDGINSTSFLRSDATDTFTNLSGTSLTLGSGVKLSESAHRSDLLLIESQTSGWAGIQIDNTSSETVWSLMADGTTCGLYDDTSNVWLWQATDSAGVRLYYNGAEKLETNSTGVEITGNAAVSGSVYEGGTALSSKYLGITATAAQASKVTVNNSTSSTFYPVVWHNNSNGLYDTATFKFQASTGTVLANKFQGTLVGNANTATWADTVDVNAGSNSATWYNVVWHNSDTLYSAQSSKAVEIQSSTGSIRAAGSVEGSTLHATARLGVPDGTSSSGNQGDIRFNTDTDGFEGHNGSAWSSLGQVINPNLLVNGDFSVWQRGTSFVQSGETYTADRVKVQSSVADWEAHQIEGNWNDGMVGKPWMQRIRGTGTYENTVFSVENGANLYKGKTLTFTVRGKFEAGIVYTIQVRRSSTGTGGTPLMNTTFIGINSQDQTHTFTFTLADEYDDTLAHLLVQVEHVNEPNNTISHFYDVKLELGTVSTPFIYDDPATNRAKCERYYYKAPATGYPLYAHQINTSARQAFYSFPTTMRVNPTMSIAWNNSPGVATSFYVSRGGFTISMAIAASSTAVGIGSNWSADAEL